MNYFHLITWKYKCSLGFIWYSGVSFRNFQVWWFFFCPFFPLSIFRGPLFHFLSPITVSFLCFLNSVSSSAFLHVFTLCPSSFLFPSLIQLIYFYFRVLTSLLPSNYQTVLGNAILISHQYHIHLIFTVTALELHVMFLLSFYWKIVSI